WDAEDGAFFFTSADHEALITRTKDFYDNAIPGGNSVAAHVLTRLALLTGEESYRQKAEQVLKLLKPAMLRVPSAFGHLLCALDTFLASPYEVALIGAPESEDTRRLIAEVFSRYSPNKVVALARAGDERAAQAIKLLEGRSQIENNATAYVCRNFYCEAPVTDAAQLRRQLSQ
ncbi:MAG TPA: thioredoxin domain-containing protein, partial [Blastocatellia bacterium]|nr:thioredoxin domain-containing protein [Blastocatellia bacterium]